jgi:hypothetical protein
MTLKVQGTCEINLGFGENEPDLNHRYMLGWGVSNHDDRFVWGLTIAQDGYEDEFSSMSYYEGMPAAIEAQGDESPSVWNFYASTGTDRIWAEWSEVSGIVTNFLKRYAGLLQSGPPSARDIVRVNQSLADVLAERLRQFDKWGVQHHPDGVDDHWSVVGHAKAVKDKVDRKISEGTVTWADILEEEVAEAMCEPNETRLAIELIQIAAVALAWYDDIKSRKGK